MKAVGIDIGTTTICAVVVDIETAHLKKAYTTQNDSFLVADHPWEKIQDPEKIVKSVLRLLDEIIAANDDIKVIGLTGQMHGILYADNQGKAISPLYTWQDQRGTQPYEEEKCLSDILSQRYKIPAYTGYGLVTHLFNAGKGLIPQGAYSVQTIMDYVASVLTNSNDLIIHSSNAASLGFFDLKRGAFSEEIIHKESKEHIMLPRIVETLNMIGSYQKIPVCVPIGDNQASFIGAVEDIRDTILVNIGTGGQISIYVDEYMEVPGLELRPLWQNGYLLVGSSLCGGRAYAMVKDFFAEYAEAMGIQHIDHYEIMGKLAQKGMIQKEKLKACTSFSGTRELPEKRGEITNIGTDNFTPEAVITAVLEGIADELHEMYLKINEKNRKNIRTIIASGNGIRKNSNLQAMMGNKFSLPLKMAEYSEEAAYGAAKAGMIAMNYVRILL